MSVVTCLLNQKGGVGKTSTCYHLAGTLAQLGRRVLLVDNDPQASLTQVLLGPEAMFALDAGNTIAGIYRGDDPFPGQVIRTVLGGINLVPGSDLVTPYNAREYHQADRQSQVSLREFLRPIRDNYDHVIIDCTPTLYFGAWAALAASDTLLIPLPPEDFAIQGIGKVLDFYDLARQNINPSLALSGYLLTRYVKSRAIHKKFEELLRGAYGDDVLQTTIPEAVDYPEAVTAQMPVGMYKPRGAAAKAMKALATELEARVAVRRAA